MPQLTPAGTPAPSSGHSFAPVATTRYGSGPTTSSNGNADAAPCVAASAGQRKQTLFLRAKSVKRNDDHHELSIHDKVEYKYLKKHIKRTFSNISEVTGVQEHVGAEQKSGLRCLFYTCIFVGTLVCAGVMPISVAWAKERTGDYPFMISVWLLAFKMVILLMSIGLYYVYTINAREGEQSNPESLPALARLRLGLWMLPPAVLYTIGDLMTFPILQLTDPATYTVLMQFKIVVTALLLFGVLRRHVSLLQGIAVSQLMCAATLFKYKTFIAMLDGIGSGMGAGSGLGVMLIFLKVGMVSVAAVWSDWSFKRVVGKDSLPFPEQQVFFAFWTVLSALCYFVYTDLPTVLSGERTLFDGFDFPSVVCLLLFSLYGMLVALFLRYLDSLLKLVMQLLAIIITTFLSVRLFGTAVSVIQYFSIVFIIQAAVVYKLGTVKPKAAKPKAKMTREAEAQLMTHALTVEGYLNSSEQDGENMPSLKDIQI